MKRGLIFLLLTVAAFQTYASTTSKDRDIPAELPVYWDLTNDIEEAYSYNFGFYKDNAGTSFENDTLTLISNNDVTGVLKGEGNVYIKWDIAAPMTVKLALSGSGAMAGKAESGSTSTPINWKASWSSTSDNVSINPENAATVTTSSIGSTEASTASYQPATIITHNGSASQYMSSGYCKIDIETANAFTAEAGTYSATLTLKIENN